MRLPLHRPVLVESCAAHIFGTRSGLMYIDCNLGDGGFTSAILDKDPTAVIHAFELDTDIIPQTLDRLGPDKAKQITVHPVSFDQLEATLQPLGLMGTVAGAVVDPGLRLGQAMSAEHGFSYSADGPLRMTFDPNAEITAADYLAQVSVNDLTQAFVLNGITPRDAHKVAEAIVARRRTAPLQTTGNLRELIIETLGRVREGKRHVATRFFQAIRTQVTGELEALRSLLPQLLGALEIGGTAAILTYQGDEARIAREFTTKYKRARPDAPEGLRLELLTPSPERPSREEIRRNPAARSALLRVFRRTQ